MPHVVRFARLILPLAACLLASCSTNPDGLEAAPGTPSCQLIFAQGILETTVSGAQPVQPLQINGLKPSLRRASHNSLQVPAGPLTIVVQGFSSDAGSGASASASFELKGKPGEVYRFAHMPVYGQTTFIVVDSQNRVLGTHIKALEATPSQAALFMRIYE